MRIKESNAFTRQLVNVGVILGAAPPKQPGLSQFMSSATRRRTLGLFFGATNCCEKPLTESTNRHSSNTNLME